ncbi:MAG: hypothetical protein JEY91_16850, partial [Spirochaetaceae bacterium]|nr:hypothetical protein [Spirochaetaceae bacterium]
MRIRQKMLFMELSTATAFIITIALFFILLGNITELKNAEIQSQKVFNKLNRVNYRAVISVNNRTAFTQSYIKWNEAIIDFSVYLQDLKQSKGINLLGRELTKRIDAVSEEWSDMRSEIIADFDIRIK